MAKTVYLYCLVISYFKTWNSFLRTPVIYQCQFSSAKLNHANLITNEKGSIIESETDICLTRARLFVLIVMSRKRKICDDGDTYWGNPFVLISKAICLIGYSLLDFHLVFGVIVWKKATKEIYPQFCSVEKDDAGVVFTGMSKVIRIRFGFAFLLFLFCTETLASLAIARPIRGKANQS